MPARLTLPPVSTMKGTKSCWSAYLALLVAAYLLLLQYCILLHVRVLCSRYSYSSTYTVYHGGLQSLLQYATRWAAVPAGPQRIIK